MYCRVIACDFDGTSAVNGYLEPQVASALGSARAQGYVTILVTGRVLDEIRDACSDCSIFDAVVAENGGVVWLCQSARTLQIGVPPPDRFLVELRGLGVPFHTGTVVVGTSSRHAPEVLEAVRRSSLDSQLVFNREALMILPGGVNKAAGVERALEELGRSERNLVAFGDAENDLALLTTAEVGVAARGAVPALADRADHCLSLPGGAGVAQHIHQILAQNGVVPTPRRHSVALGRNPEGRPVLLPASGINVAISGDPRTGKSWVAGLVAEHLIERGYRLCIIDPEGDYAALGQRPRVVVLGNDIPLPRPAVTSRLLAQKLSSVVVNLGALPLKEQTAYVEALLAELEICRAASGVPHWILIDEAHYFFHEDASAGHLKSRTGNFILVTYRPSLLAGGVYGYIQAHIVTGTMVEEERYFITSLLQARGPRTLLSWEALGELDMPRAGLLIADGSDPSWQVFVPGQRATFHAHHGRKYADTRLPDDKAFRFLYTEGPAPMLAYSVLEFYKAVSVVPMASLRHHLAAGDFSRWVTGVLGDEQLASGLRKLERTIVTGGLPNREEVLAHIRDHYLIGERAAL